MSRAWAHAADLRPIVDSSRVHVDSVVAHVAFPVHVEQGGDEAHHRHRGPQDDIRQHPLQEPAPQQLPAGSETCP